MSSTPEQRKANRRLGLILASVAVAFMVGFMVKMTWLGR
ncbi:cytochrome oxidase small assembly protein [Roseateles sp. DB2]